MPLAPAQTNWLVIWTAIFAGVIVGFQVGKAPPVIAAIQVELQLMRVEAGWYMSVYNAVAVLAGLACGVFTDRIGRRRAVTLGLLMLLAGNLIGAWAPSYTPLILARLIEGAGFALVAVSVPGLITRVVSDQDRDVALSAWSTYLPTGFAIMMAGISLTTEAEHWRTVWLINAGLIAAFLVLFLYVTRNLDKRKRPANEPGLQLLTVIRRAGPWLLGLSFMSYTLQWFGVLTWLPTIMTDVGMTDAVAGLAVAAVVFANVIGNLAAGYLLKRGIPRWRILAFCSLSLGLLAQGIYAGELSPEVRLLLAGLFSAIGGAIPGVVMAGAATHSPSQEQVATTNGVIVQCTNLGSLVGPPAVAWVSQMSGAFENARWLILASALAGVLIALIIRIVERRMQDARQVGAQ